MTLRRFYIPGPLLLVALCIGCDRADPLEPAVPAAAAAGPGSTLSAPSATNAAAVSERRIDVGWQDNSTNESGFEVQRSTMGPAGTFTVWASTAAGVTSYGDVGLTHSTQYCYKVRAFRTTGSKPSYSAFSNTACGTTLAPPPPPPPPVPAAPSAAEAKPVNSTAVLIAWIDNSSTEDGFRIERSLDAGSTWEVAGSVPTGGALFTYLDEGRTSEQQVCYRVIAFNAAGDSAPSDTDCTTPPAGPTNLTVDPATGELTWADNSGVEAGYEVWVCDLGDYSCAWQMIESLPPNSVSGGETSCNSLYYVVATKDGGYSGQSNAVTGTCSSNPSAGARVRP